MKPYQQRVVDEKLELDEKREKLKAFIMAPEKFFALSQDERILLKVQLEIMDLYSKTLEARIAIFTP